MAPDTFMAHDIWHVAKIRSHPLTLTLQKTLMSILLEESAMNHAQLVLGQKNMGLAASSRGTTNRKINPTCFAATVNFTSCDEMALHTVLRQQFQESAEGEEGERK